MKFIQWTLAIVGMIALAIVGTGFFLPSRFDVARTIVIDAPAERIYDLIAEPRLWMRWSAPHKRDPAMDVTYAGPPFGQGAKWSWASKQEGSGSLEFTRVDPNKRVEYSLYLPIFNQRSTGAFSIEGGQGGQRVTWTNSGDVGPNPLKHYIAEGMDRMIGPEFEASLANLKVLAEKP